MIIQGTSLAARYPGASGLALDDVSCEVHPGRMLAVVGPNGGGKSTLLRALLGVLPLESGEVRLRGRPLVEWKRRDVAKVIGVVSQREEVFFPLPVEDTVMMARYARLGPLSEPGGADRGAVQSALARCDLLGFRTRRTDTLSGGEWQRVRVARAVAQEPEALLLDEPTVALDIRHEMEVFELVRQLTDEGLGSLVITHHLNLAARYADELLLLHRGRVAAQGAPGSVMQAKVLTEVFDWPVTVDPWRDGTPQVAPLRPAEATPS